MSLDLARNVSYAHLDDAWLRHQSARICQRHLQFGQHFRLDLDALLAATARLLPSLQHARAERAPLTKSVVIANGSTAAIPHMPGLDTVEFWTNRQAAIPSEL